MLVQASTNDVIQTEALKANLRFVLEMKEKACCCNII